MKRASIRSIWAAALIVLRVTLLILCLAPSLTPAQAAASTTYSHEQWIERLNEVYLNGTDSYRIVQELSELDGDMGFQLLQEAWPTLYSDSKLFLLGQLTILYHPRILDILYLGATDPSLIVQNRALQSLETFSLQDFNEDYGGYVTWRMAYAGKPLKEVLLANARRYAAELSASKGQRTQSLLSLLQRSNAYGYSGRMFELRRDALIKGGVADVLAGLVDQQATSWLSMQMLRILRPDEAFLKRVFLPLLNKTTNQFIRQQALTTLGSASGRWAAGAVLQHLVDEYPDPVSEAMAGALAQMGAAETMPTLISILESDNSSEGRRLIGYTLNQMAGMVDGQIHDAAWWRDWWQRNLERFPPEIRGLPFPKLSLRARVVTPAEPTQFAPEQRFVGGDHDRGYWLISPIARIQLRTLVLPQIRMALRPGVLAPPPPPGQQATQVQPQASSPSGAKPVQAAPGLIVVLSDGDGKPQDRLDMWVDIAHRALGDHYYIAILTPPPWKAPDLSPWVTHGVQNSVKEAKDSIEAFAASVARDVETAHQINSSHVYLHGVAESGPASYACALDADTPFHGFYILSSRFRSTGLPPLTNGKGRTLYIENNRDDKDAPYLSAEAARKVLKDNGATVRLVEFTGGHAYGFDDNDPGKHVLAAINWLESSH